MVFNTFNILEKNTCLCLSFPITTVNGQKIGCYNRNALHQTCCESLAIIARTIQTQGIKPVIMQTLLLQCSLFSDKAVKSFRNVTPLTMRQNCFFPFPPPVFWGLIRTLYNVPYNLLQYPKHATFSNAALLSS